MRRVSHAYQNALRRSDHVAVCLIGFSQRVPRYIGDNEGCWPVRVSAASDPVRAVEKLDVDQPIHQLAILGFVWCPSDVHAKWLKTTIDEILLGRRPEDNRLRHGWRNLIDPEIVWPIVLNDALRSLRQAMPEFDVFGEVERDARIRRSMEV